VPAVGKPLAPNKWDVWVWRASNAVEGKPVNSLLYTISIFAEYRGTQEVYSVEVLARNGEKLFHQAEAASISGALEKLVEQMRLQEKKF
jgi:hypothetical protein